MCRSFSYYFLNQNKNSQSEESQNNAPYFFFFHPYAHLQFFFCLAIYSEVRIHTFGGGRRKGDGRLQGGRVEGGSEIPKIARSRGDIAGNYATLCNIWQSEKHKEAGSNKNRSGTAHTNTSKGVIFSKLG